MLTRSFIRIRISFQSSNIQSLVAYFGSSDSYNSEFRVLLYRSVLLRFSATHTNTRDFAIHGSISIRCKQSTISLSTHIRQYHEHNLYKCLVISLAISVYQIVTISESCAIYTSIMNQRTKTRVVAFVCIPRGR